MADNITLNSGSGGATLAADDVASVWYQQVKLVDGTLNSTTAIAAGNGTNGGALRVTVASDSTGVLAVTDNGGSLTVDNGGTFAVQATVAAGATNIAKAEDAASANADVGVPAMAVRKATPANTSDTDGDYEMLQMSGGRLWVDPSGVTLTVASHAVTNAGTFAVQVDGNALTSLQLLDDVVATAGAAALTKGNQVAGTDGTNARIVSTNTSGHVNIADGGNSITVDNGGTFAVQSTLQAGTSLVGDVGISGARTSGGTTFHTNAGTSTLTQIKATAGQLYWLHVMNLKASVLYLQVFNKASASVTLGTTTPDMTFPIPTQGTTSGAGFTLAIPNGIAMGTGISYAITTTATGATAASSGEAYLNAGYA